MKKFLLSVFVIISSIFYIASQRLGSRNDLSYAQTQNVPSSGSGSSSPATTSNRNAKYKDGQYTGSPADAYYGNIKVQVTIQDGKIADVQFLDYPQDRNTSIAINNKAMSKLKTEAIKAQDANVEIISGATDTSQAFRESLSAALSQAIS